MVSSRIRRAAAGTVIGLLAVGCGGTEPGAAADSADGARKILRVAYNREIDVLNAFTSQMLIDIHLSMVEGLITTDENNTYVPVLAKQIPTEENGLVVRNEDGTIDMTWELHENVRWHDGEKLTSADVCFTWAFVTSEGSETYNRDHYLGIIDCQTPDDYTVVMRWDDAYGFYAGLFEAILPKHVLGNMTTREIINYVPYNRGTETIGTGPFRFAEWKSGEYIRVVRNDDYWRGPQYPRIDEIVWSFVPDSNARLNAMRTGRYDYGQIEPTQVGEVADLTGYDTHLVNLESVHAPRFGCQHRAHKYRFASGGAGGVLRRPHRRRAHAPYRRCLLDPGAASADRAKRLFARRRNFRGGDRRAAELDGDRPGGARRGAVDQAARLRRGGAWPRLPQPAIDHRSHSAERGRTHRSGCHPCSGQRHHPGVVAELPRARRAAAHADEPTSIASASASTSTTPTCSWARPPTARCSRCSRAT